MSELKPSVPKFGSFKPKPISPSHDQPEKETVKHHRLERDSVKDSYERRKVRRTHSKDLRRDTSTDRSPSLKRRDIVEVRHPSPPLREEVDEIFVIDRKGDVKNLVYGSIHRYSIPPFHRSGAGSVLGTPSYLRIDRDYGDDKGIILRDRRLSQPRHREKYIFSKLGKVRPQLLKIRPDVEVQNSTEQDYVTLQNSRGKKRKRGSVSGSGSDDGDTNYRSIHGKAKDKSNDVPEDENFRYATESDSGSENGRIIQLDAEVRQKMVELSRTVEQAPHNIAAWLALIAHQDTVLAGDLRVVTNAELRSTADIKIHMFEQALQYARSLEDRETLLLGLMVEGSKIWELKVQTERWEKIAMENIDSLMLWKSYLNFRQTTFGTFQYEEVKDIFLNRMKLLLQATSTHDKRSIYLQILYIVLRLTIFIRESGYTELAVAIWQGLLEFNFFTPLDLSDPVKAFKEFWDSEIPRIGEDTALGWRHSVENEGASDAPNPLNDEERNVLETHFIFKSWAATERLRAKVSRLPARTMDNVIENDPFRVILASDIGDFLISFPSEIEELRAMLVDAFLLFCRLPSLKSTINDPRGWSGDPFIGESLLESDSAWIERQYSREGVDHNGERQVELSSIFKTPTSKCQNSPESMFGLSWFKNMRPWRDIFDGDNGPVQYKFLRNTLKQLLQAYYTEDLAEYFLSFEWRNEPESIKKVSKSLLKQHPSSLRLYNAYAMIEWCRGNRELANNVYYAALDMAKAVPEKDRDGSIVLWKSWIWACVEARDNPSAVTRLLSIESGVPNEGLVPNPVQLLKTKQLISQRRDDQLYSGSMFYAVQYAECLALLEYLTSPPNRHETQSSIQGNITDALEVFTNFSRTLQQTFKDRNISDQSAHELFLQSAARLLYHHAKTGPFRPALLREHLTAYITIYPQNTIFISLYMFNESRLRIDNRVRHILSSTILTPIHDTLTSRLFATYYELKHGTIYSVRSAFEKALSSPAKYSPGLWRLFILYTLQIPQLRPQAKDLWYRAIRACPWAKELYITGFENLDGIEREELMGTWRVMEEKGLRVHVDLEDALESDR